MKSNNVTEKKYVVAEVDKRCKADRYDDINQAIVNFIVSNNIFYTTNKPPPLVEDWTSYTF